MDPGQIFSFKKSSPVRRALRHVRTHHIRRLRGRFARFRRDRSGATFIGVTGSSAKSTTTAFLAHVLAGHGKVRGQAISNSVNALIKTLTRHSRDEKYVVAELGVGGKHQMRPMAEMLSPDVAIVTLIGLEHYSQFRTRQAVADEKGIMVEQVRPDGLVLLNADDEFAMGMAALTRARVVTFGRSDRADYRVISSSASFPRGLTVEIVWSGGGIVLQTRFIAEHFWLSIVAAVAAAIELGVPLDIIASQAASFEALTSRCEVYPIEGGPTFILDTAKAPYETLNLAFRAVETAIAPSKRIVLGHISDYAGSSRSKYRAAYKAARAVSDEVIFVGDNAHRSGASEADREAGRFHEMRDPRQVYEYIRATAREGEVILLKGSQNLHLERIALAWRTDVQCWQPACGESFSCKTCGLFAVPYDGHKAAKRARRKPWARLFQRWSKDG